MEKNYAERGYFFYQMNVFHKLPPEHCMPLMYWRLKYCWNAFLNPKSLIAFIYDAEANSWLNEQEFTNNFWFP